MKGAIRTTTARPPHNQKGLSSLRLDKFAIRTIIHTGFYVITHYFGIGGLAAVVGILVVYIYIYICNSRAD